jgi:short-subunit dehydrogenase
MESRATAIKARPPCCTPGSIFIIKAEMTTAQSVPDCLNSFGAVVITGASSGIGEEFVKTVATINPKARFFNLSRTPPSINVENNRLRHCPADLSSASGQETAVAAVEEWLDGEGAGTNGLLLINNSGFGSYGEFPEPNVARTLAMVDLNMRAPVLLTGRLLPRLQARGGAVVNIASIAAFQPTPLLSVYGATKAFVLNWSLGLWRELLGTNVHVLCVCPGPTSTNFFREAGFSEPPLPGDSGQTSPQVVSESLRALAARKPFVVCGWANRMGAIISCRLPRALVTSLAYNMTMKMRLGPLAKKSKSGASPA